MFLDKCDKFIFQKRVAFSLYSRTYFIFVIILCGIIMKKKKVNKQYREKEEREMEQRFKYLIGEKDSSAWYCLEKDKKK